MKKQQPISVPEKQMFVTWDEGDDRGKALAMRQASQALSRTEPIVRLHGSNIWMNIQPGTNTSVRDSMDRRDYEAFRRGEALPVKPKDVIAACMAAYDNVGIIRNIIDLMADFATQGIDLNHPNERIEKWYKEWFRRAGGKERSERFLNLLYRTGNVIVQRHTAKLTVRQERKMRSQAAPDMDVPDGPQMEKREVPWKYTFRNPLMTEVLADELSLFVGQDSFVFAIKLPKTLSAKVKSPRTEVEKNLVRRLPPDVLEAVRSGSKFIPLDPEKVRGFYYKRDDWQVWARPMVSAVLSDLQVLQKMKLADLAALDGAISCIRVWKLGNIEARIMPTEAAINRLAEMLCNNVGGGVMDLVWGPEIDLLETKTDVHHFLGETKYAPVLTAIYAGLGIPPTLTGAAGSNGGGFTNNFISLKTLTERLQYGRDILAKFWEEEIRLVQKSMGFRFPATLVFDRMVLTDEAAEKQLLINLADRDLISIETLQERFGESPEIEQVRIRREARKRAAGQMPEKASPFHSAEKQHDLKKLFVQSGTVAPSQVGVTLDEKKKGEKAPAEMQADLAPKPAPGGGPKGQPGQGRPRNKKDSRKRKKKRVVPRTSAVFFQTMGWAENAQARIGQLAGAAYLKALGKKTMRELTDEEARKFEAFKFHALCQLEPNEAVDGAAVGRLSRGKLDIPEAVASLLKATTAKHVEVNGREPTLETLRRYQAGAYAFWKGDFQQEEEWVDA